MKIYLIKYLFFAHTLLITFNAYSQYYRDENKFSVHGIIKDFQKEYIYLDYIDTLLQYKIDSAKIINDTFNFIGYISEPMLATLRADKIVRDFNSPKLNVFFLEPSEIKISLNGTNFKEAFFMGSKSDIVYRANLEIKKPILKKLEIIESEFNFAKNKYIKQKLETDYILQFKRMVELDLSFIRKNITSFVSMYLLQFIYNNISVNDFSEIFKKFDTKLQNSNLGKKINAFLKKAKSLDVGKLSPDFSQPDINDTMVTLSKLKGKYVLLDFWASWCAPCRRSFESLKKIYSKYKNNKLFIIAISSDEDEEAWKKAIKIDGIETWCNIRTTKNYPSVNDLYQINELPTKFLIDSNGRIIDKYMASEEWKLYKKLKTIFEK